ncbi:MAG: peptidase M29, partial [Pseudomonadota bacterium]|nr:peptidase M29 [Pseudomonadota bacterium]
MQLEPHWKDAFAGLFELCKAHVGETVTILTETLSRKVNVALASATLAEMKIPAAILNVPSKPPVPGMPVIRSTGASNALSGERAAVAQLQKSDLVIDLTVEGLMHAPETPYILKAGARIMTISNEHPEILARLRPDPAMKDVVRAAVTACRDATTMRVTSPSGTDLTVAMGGTVTVGVWGWTDRPGTLAHWPGGLV